ncbi:MAG: hypothetical protein H7Y20_13050 [Bryobacteraceae bacterium]|nr:hypothetical protein [Bryobacteraceae bacterium]
MNFIRMLTLWTGRFLPCIAAIFISISYTTAQTIKLSPTTSTKGIAPVFGEYLALPELERPEWRNETGVEVARLRLVAADTAAWQVTFRSLSLGAGSEMFLYGVNAQGAILSTHGPYQGHGPLNVPWFETQVIEGAEVVIEVRGGPNTRFWPFEIESVERIGPSEFAALQQKGLQVQAVHRPAKPERKASEVRTTWLEDQLVRYQVVDGLAVMESDIVLGPAAGIEGGNAAKGSSQRHSHHTNVAGDLWPNGVMPYTIEYSPSGITQGSVLEAKILGAINYMNQRLPGILVPRTTHSDFVTFRFLASKCQSPRGRQGGQQFVEVDSICQQGGIVHEASHAAGMRHEHQRPDRDAYVRILWNNINPDLKFAFEIPPSGTSQALGPYDYGSIMHYGLRAGAAAYYIEETMQVLQPLPPGVIVGQLNGYSAGDEAGIRARYCQWPPMGVSSTSISSVSALGGTYNLAVTVAAPFCSWTTSEISTWVTVGGPAWKTGSGTLSITLSPNLGRTRSAVVYVMDGNVMRVVSISQKGENNRF